MRAEATSATTPKPKKSVALSGVPAGNTALSTVGRQGNDLHCTVPVNVGQATLGAEIDVPTLEEPYRLKIPEGTQNGAQFRLRHIGVPSVNGGGRGDIYVHIEVRVPSKLTREQRKLFEQLRDTLPVENQPTEKSLLGKVRDYFM